MRVTLELPVIATEDEGTVYREPDLFGATATWGQIEDRGVSMIVSAEIDPEELAKIPEGCILG